MWQKQTTQAPSLFYDPPMGRNFQPQTPRFASVIVSAGHPRRLLIAHIHVQCVHRHIFNHLNPTASVLNIFLDQTGR